MSNKVIKYEPYDDDLLYKLSSFNFNHIPLPILVQSSILCNGECHFIGIYLTFGMKNFKYINGNINRFSYSDKPNHSWVEYDGYVYDPTECVRYKKDYYYNKFDAKIIEEYDDHSIKDYWLYNESLKYIDTDEEVDNNIVLLLQSLEYYESVLPTKSGKQLLRAIEEYREEYNIDYYFSEKDVKNYTKINNWS